MFARRIASGKYDPVREAEKYLRTEGRTIVVSFTSDPYPPEEARLGRTRRVLEVLSRNPRNRVMLLTKNPLLALRDLDLMLRHGDMWLGTTVTTLSDELAGSLEPGAPHPRARLEALRVAHEAGVKTWLSVEPIIPLATTLKVVCESMEFVDFYVLGSLNYAERLGLLEGDSKLLESWYKALVPRMVEVLERHNKQYIIKKELKRYL